MSGTIFASLLEDRVRETAGWLARRAEPAPAGTDAIRGGSFLDSLVADRMRDAEGGAAIGGRLKRALEAVEAEAATRVRQEPCLDSWARNRPVLAGFGLALLLLGSGWIGRKAAPFAENNVAGSGAAALFPAGDVLQAEKS